jgi:hypothetical protein
MRSTQPLVILGTAGAIMATATAYAQLNTCEALTLYGNAAGQRLCKSLSPTTQNLWVCELASGQPDIHTTFNAATPLHLTVRNNPAPPGCEGNVQLNGVWPAGIVAANQNPICGVNVVNYVARLNAVQRMQGGGGQSACRQAFITAGASGRISQPVMQSYLNACDVGNAGAACP